MTLVNAETGELIERPTYSEVRGSIAVAREAGAKFFEQIVWQVERRAWEVLGYADWDAMREAEYADMGVVVPRADRPEIVTRLRRVGLTQQAIADTVGVSKATVVNDLKVSSDFDGPPIIKTSRGTRPATYTRTPEPEAAPDSRPADPTSEGRGEGAVHTPPAPVCERPALEQQADDFLAGEQAVQDAQYVGALLKVAKNATEVTSFDPERIARIADANDLMALDALASGIASWHRRLNSAGNSGLRVLPGGAQ